MSVEKLSDSSKSIIEDFPFVQILNEVTEHIKDNDAFRVWAFSLSKSRDWKVLKEYTQKVCGVGKRKGEQVWSYLRRSGLIEYIRIIDKETGKYIRTDIKILTGTRFNKEIPFIKPTPALSAGVDKPLLQISTPALSAAAEMYPLLNKDITNKDFALPKKEKSFCVSQNRKAENERKPDWAVPKPVNEQPKQITKFWEPGNPDYDRVNSKG